MSLTPTATCEIPRTAMLRSSCCRRRCLRAGLATATEHALGEPDDHAEGLVRADQQRARLVELGMHPLALQELARPAQVARAVDEGVDALAVAGEVLALVAVVRAGLDQLDHRVLTEGHEHRALAPLDVLGVHHLPVEDLGVQ